MRLTKDEAYMLSHLMNEGKYELNDEIKDWAHKQGLHSMLAFESLHQRLEVFSDDQRRQGRRSQNSFSDVLKRFVKKERRGQDTINV